MALGPVLPTKMVCPSPFWRTTSDVPMEPPPPDRFSTIADWPQAFCRCAASIRPITSVLPPAAAGTMRRTVSVGRQSAAWPRRGKAAVAETAAAADSTPRRESVAITCHSQLRLSFYGSVGNARQAGKRRVGEGGLVEAEQLEQRRQVAELLARGRRGAADEIEYPAVLHSVIGEPLHLAVLVEIDRDHPLVDEPLVHEGDRTLGALRNVVEHLAVEGCDRGRRSHHDQHLILARPDRDLLQRAGGKDVAFLKLFAGASAQRRAHQGDRGNSADAAPAREQAARSAHTRAFLARHSHSGTGPVPLHRARR